MPLFAVLREFDRQAPEHAASSRIAAEKSRPLPQCHFGPRRRLGIAAGKEMGERDATLGAETERIERAQAHARGSAAAMRHLRLARRKASDPAAILPRRYQVRIERERAINAGGRTFEVADHMSERIARPKITRLHHPRPNPPPAALAVQLPLSLAHDCDPPFTLRQT